ncbi:unnamed protein product [Effrenium voratum]|nr:unnamed protein product [Effrenium voratum]
MWPHGVEHFPPQMCMAQMAPMRDVWEVPPSCGSACGFQNFDGNQLQNFEGWSPSMPSMVSNMMPNLSVDTAAPFSEPEERRYSGTVKCFYGEKHTGHGFIFCPDIYQRTGQDVYLHARQAHRCEVGDEVSFTIVFNSRREPQARSVVRKQDEGKFLSRKKQEAEKQASALQQKRSLPVVEVPSQPGAVMTEEQARKFQKSLKGYR